MVSGSVSVATCHRPRERLHGAGNVPDGAPFFLIVLGLFAIIGFSLLSPSSGAGSLSDAATEAGCVRILRIDIAISRRTEDEDAVRSGLSGSALATLG